VLVDQRPTQDMVEKIQIYQQCPPISQLGTAGMMISFEGYSVTNDLATTATTRTRLRRDPRRVESRSSSPKTVGSSDCGNKLP
jgi:hypothetical protein